MTMQAIVAIILLCAGNFADYCLQAFQHGWAWQPFDLAPRSAKHPWYLAWLPPDAWHLAHTVMISGFLLAAVSLWSWHAPWILLVIPANWLARGLCFTLPRKLTQGY